MFLLGKTVMDEILTISATRLQDMLKKKSLSCLEVMQAYLKRIEQVNPRLNAIVKALPKDEAIRQAKEADEKIARGAAIGKLHGIPITIKDGRQVKGFLCTLGTNSPMNYVAQEDATVVARLRSEGAIVIGITNLPDFSMSYETDNAFYGRTQNPYNLHCSPGGSSGGQAAILAAGGSIIGIGSDSGGSIRQPVHNCGITGMKPTLGLIPSTGNFPVDGLGIFSLVQTQGPMARYVEDLITMLPIIAGPDGHDPYVYPAEVRDPALVNLNELRVAYYAENGVVTPREDVVDLIHSVVKALSKQVSSVIERYPKVAKDTYLSFEELFFYGGDRGQWLRDRMKQMKVTEVAPPFQAILARAGRCEFSVTELRHRLLELDKFKFYMMDFMKDYDVIICPAGVGPANNYDEIHAESPKLDLADCLTYHLPYNITGWPAVVVRCGTSKEGMPLGVQVIARAWRDDVALAVAKRLEELFGGWQEPNL